jgi:NTP pyrophosphatase (non-canonical NTP hydrolase)
MSEHFNQLSPAQAERLFYLLEELGETQQAIGKILRHGYESRDPTKTTPTSPTNREHLQNELGDVIRAVQMLWDARDLNEDATQKVASKGPPLKYMHHQG